MSSPSQERRRFWRANFHTGAKLLTTPNPEEDRDRALFAKLGLTPVRTHAPAEEIEVEPCRAAHG